MRLTSRPSSTPYPAAGASLWGTRTTGRGCPLRLPLRRGGRLIDAVCGGDGPADVDGVGGGGGVAGVAGGADAGVGEGVARVAAICGGGSICGVGVTGGAGVSGGCAVGAAVGGVGNVAAVAVAIYA